MSTKQKRMTEISGEMTYLCAELEATSERALSLVEELENEFQETAWPIKMKKMFFIMQRLITKV